MASILKETHIDAPPEEVWDALSDVGALHTRLAPGFVTDTHLNGNTRTVRFANGKTVREEIVSVDDHRRRVCWAIVGQQFHHYNGVAWVEPDGLGSRFVWVADLLPDELGPQVDEMMGKGIAIIKKAQESRATAASSAA